MLALLIYYYYLDCIHKSEATIGMMTIRITPATAAASNHFFLCTFIDLGLAMPQLGHEEAPSIKVA